MSAQPNFTARFVRRTQLATNEYHKNFYKLDREITASITSPEADQVTPLMSKIYLRLINAPEQYWEREGVLHFEADSREGKQVKAWDVFCEVVGVASATANKAMTWLHRQGIIGYFAGKNGVGLRIFLNRASASIGVRATSAGQKILHFAPASSGEGHASQNEAAFSDSFADLEVLDSYFDPDAPKNGANKKTAGKISSAPIPTSVSLPAPAQQTGREVHSPFVQANAVPVDELVRRLRGELEPCLREAAAQAASQASVREMAQTRRWFEERVLPKAVRVAQHETYGLLKKLGTLDERKERVRADLQVGRAPCDDSEPAAKPLSPEEITDTAETCVALLEMHGKEIDATLSEISTEGGGWLLPEDASRVREESERLLRERGERKR